VADRERDIAKLKAAARQTKHRAKVLKGNLRAALRRHREGAAKGGLADVLAARNAASALITKQLAELGSRHAWLRSHRPKTATEIELRREKRRLQVRWHFGLLFGYVRVGLFLLPCLALCGWTSSCSRCRLRTCGA
jgi:hypothetical protein